MQFKKKLNLKPVSVNEAWNLRGFRKFKSAKYNKFQKEFFTILGKKKWPFKLEDYLNVTVKIGFSNRQSDLDNALKPLFDTLSTHYGWNDNKIYKIKTEKFIVEKGKEYIDVKFTLYSGTMS